MTHPLDLQRLRALYDAATPIRFADCPPGLFWFRWHLHLKSEYSTQVESGKWNNDAYCVESGEYFAGGVDSYEERDNLFVVPIDYDAAIGAHNVFPALLDALDAQAAREAARKAEVERLNATINELRELFKIDGEQHSKFVKNIIKDHERRITAYAKTINTFRAEVAALKAEREWRPIWTPEQVKMLEKRQRDPRSHPYTCGHRDDGKHFSSLGLDLGALVPTIYGWICPSCEYRHNRAHEIPTPPTETNDE